MELQGLIWGCTCWRSPFGAFPKGLTMKLILLGDSKGTEGLLLAIEGKTISGFVREAELAINKMIFCVGYMEIQIFSFAFTSVLCKHRVLVPFQKLQWKN